MDRDQFLDIGKHCNEPSCHQLDFLPLACPSCRLPFCQLHWKPPSGHNCPKYDQRLIDNVIPSCPLCSQPVSSPLSLTNPDQAVDQHLSTSCPALQTTKSPNQSHKSSNICQEKKCKTKMVVPISCDKCRGKFCAAHRWTTDHQCTGKPNMPSTSKPSSARINLSGLSALRRAQESVKSSAKTSNDSSLGTRQNPIVINDDTDSDIEILTPKPAQSKLPISSTKKVLAGVGVGNKVDKRAVAEQESARKALENRAKKGLLTEDEKLKYATMQALHTRQSAGKKGDNCVLS